VVTIDKLSILLISEVIYQQFHLARNQKKKGRTHPTTIVNQLLLDCLSNLHYSSENVIYSSTYQQLVSKGVPPRISKLVNVILQKIENRATAVTHFFPTS